MKLLLKLSYSYGARSTVKTVVSSATQTTTMSLTAVVLESSVVVSVAAAARAAAQAATDLCKPAVILLNEPNELQCNPQKIHASEMASTLVITLERRELRGHHVPITNP